MMQQKYRAIIYCLFLGFLYPSTLSWTFGDVVPYGTYDAYSKTGNHYKINYKRQFNNYENLEFSLGGQYIYFGEDIISNDSWGGVQIRDGEKSTMFDFGFTYSRPEGLFGDGIFKPYVNTSLGIAFFKQYTVYDYPNTYSPCGNDSLFDLFDIDTFIGFVFFLLDIGDDDCSPQWDDNEEYSTTDRLTSPYFSLDIGAMIPAKNSSFAIDFGIKYNAITRIQKIEYNDFDPNVVEVFNDIGHKIGADYYTIYIGGSFKID